MKYLFFCILLAGAGCFAQTGTGTTGKGPLAAGGTGSWSARMAETIMATGNDRAVVLEGIEGLWYRTADGRYFKYIQQCMDRLAADGHPDNILYGRILLLLYKVTNQDKYYKAATLLRAQLKDQPRTREDSSVRPAGQYMAQPFYAEYAALFHEDSIFDDIATQFISQAGPVSGFSNSRSQADRSTGFSNFRGPAMGWYGMALVDALDYFPADRTGHGGRAALVTILQRYAAAVLKLQDPGTGLWWDGSSLFIYALAKGVRKGYLPASCLAAAKKGYAGVLRKFAGTDPEGAFLLASNEMECLSDLSLGKGRTVLLDYYFNNEHKKDITGATVRYHYTWEDQANSGFSLLGQVFRQYGIHTDSLPGAPLPGKLKDAALYIIVDPDDEKESPSPNYPTPEDINSIYDWVKDGGVLLLMSNDSGNCEFPHFNRLTERFGIHFNEDCRNKVTGNNYEMGAFTLPPRDSIFKTAKKIFIKEMSTIKLHEPAKAHFTESGDVIMAVAKVGKGTVFAVGDPWFYNEYLDGRKLPAEYENFKAAKDLVRWLILQSPK